jgi:F0F1-type ATP synthase assembly protein I
MVQATARYGSIGIFFGVAISIGYFAGHWLDQRWHTAPWLSLVGVLFGVASGFVELYRVGKSALKDEK